MKLGWFYTRIDNNKLNEVGQQLENILTTLQLNISR